MKKNDIMIGISLLSGSLAFFFFYLTMVPIVLISKNYEFYDFLTLILPVVMIPLLVSLCRFISLSITTDNKKIEKEVNKNGSKKTS